MAEWTSVPPTESGFYWARRSAAVSAEVARVFSDDEGWALALPMSDECWQKAEVTGWQFWPERIEPPKG